VFLDIIAILIIMIIMIIDAVAVDGWVVVAGALHCIAAILQYCSKSGR